MYRLCAMAVRPLWFAPKLEYLMVEYQGNDMFECYRYRRDHEIQAEIHPSVQYQNQ
jgi:hypothetical protein